MNLFAHILKILVPALKLWALPGMLFFGQAEDTILKATSTVSDVEAAYIYETESELADKLANLVTVSSEEAVVSAFHPKLTLFYFVLPQIKWIDTTVYLHRLQVDNFINSYIRNVFYVFVTALAP